MLLREKQLYSMIKEADYLLNRIKNKNLKAIIFSTFENGHEHFDILTDFKNKSYILGQKIDTGRVEAIVYYTEVLVFPWNDGSEREEF